MVKGVTSETLDGISIEWFEKTSKALLKRTLSFKTEQTSLYP
jgi:hypothetical protein